MTRFLLAAAFSALFVSCASLAPEDSPGRTPWSKKDEGAEKNQLTDERALIKSNEYQPGWQY
ncbi:hypothetical protein KBB96_02255 [Luteolibacter ambystomatis]|uniref:Lipoprotein n=1 Tax=Luteolibacter ambystomatis TaxID=2824561 RepID=A0A975J0E5_9BACT|nr:hypothetical protein [Luteolibacter ambystomatis]QUE51722.1 hypothetical protein KBB96_02255 [Luteolibacter ambystomatis]